MPTIPELKEQRATYLARQKELHDLSVSENRDLSAQEQAEFDAAGEQAGNEADRNGLWLRIRNAETVARDQAELSVSTPPRTGGGANTELATGTRTHISNVRERVQDDPKRGFASLGDFALNMYRACYPGAPDTNAQKRLFAATGANQANGSQGGYLVPPEFSTSIWDGLNNTPDALLPMTDSYTVTGESLTINANAETSRATGSRYGGIQAYWIAEADQITSSKPTWRQVRLEPQQIAALCYATDKLLSNAAGLSQYMSRAATEEINFLVNDAIIEGNGAGKPVGILNSSCTVSVAKQTGQPAATILKENIDKMWSRLHPRAQANARWFVNIDCQPQLDNLSMTVGTGGVPVYLPPGGISESPLGRLKGRPVQPLEFCSTCGTVGDIILADLGYYVTGVQGSMESASSMHLRFDYAETVFRFMFAVAGQPWLASALTPFKGSNTLSPFVTLATRS